MAMGMEDNHSVAEKLDEDLNDFVDEMIEKNKDYRYAHPLSEDNWEEELESIPLFMTKSPEHIDHEKSPALAALQAMKYEEDDPKANALAYKDDGNEEFKKGNYKKAIKIYAEGIKTNCGDSSLMSTLFANRANAHFKIGNYRTALNDSIEAKNIQPGYVKAIFRGACSCLELELYDDAIIWCNEGLAQDSGMKTFQDLLKKATLKKKQHERNKRKKKTEEVKKKKSNNCLADAIMSRGIKLRAISNKNEDEDSSEGEDAKEPADRLAALNLNKERFSGQASVFLDDDGVLHWPVFFVYPEYRQTDFIEVFNETQRYRVVHKDVGITFFIPKLVENCKSFLDHIQVMFGCAKIPWDVENKYRPSQLEICYETFDNASLVFVEKSMSLCQVLSDSRYIVCGGTPSFFILVKDTPFQKQFIEKYNVER